MAAKEEDSNDGMLGGLREIAQMLQEMTSQAPAHEGGENKRNSDERSNEQGSSSNHQLAGLSTTYNVLAAYKKSVLANLETRNVPVSSGEAVPLSSEPSSSDLTNVEIKRVPIGSGKKVTLLRRPPPTRMISPSGPPMSHVVKRSLDLSLKPIMNDPSSLLDKSFAIKEQLGDSDLETKYSLPDDEEVNNPIDYSSSDYDVVREHFSLLSIENNDDSKELSKIDSSSSDNVEAEQAQCETHEQSSEFTFDVKQPMNPEKAPPKPSLQRQNAMRPQRYTSDSITTASSHGRSPSISMTKALTTLYETHEHASDFTFDVKQLVNPTQAPPKPSLQRQNAMRQQRYTSEPDPMPTRDSITTASSHGLSPSISMTKALTTATDFVPKRNQQAMMNSHYSQCQVPSGQYGNITNSPYTLPNQNESYNISPQSAAAFQQLGGSNNNTLAHYGNMMSSPYLRPEQNDRYSMPQLAYGSVNLFGTSSDNVANSRVGYKGGVSRNHSSSIQQHQSGDSNVLPLCSIRSRQQRQKQPWSDFSVSPKPTKR